MKEVKTPKKPLIYYYGIVLLVLIVFNLVVSPILMEHQVEETDYGTFMSMINDKNIGKVEVEDNQIVFTDKNNEKIYKYIFDSRNFMSVFWDRIVFCRKSNGRWKGCKEA